MDMASCGAESDVKGIALRLAENKVAQKVRHEQRLPAERRRSWWGSGEKFRTKKLSLLVGDGPQKKRYNYAKSQITFLSHVAYKAVVKKPISAKYSVRKGGSQ